MKKRANDMAEQLMKVLVVSDVHGRVTPLRWLLKNETADALFFLGDGLYDLDQAIAATALRRITPSTGCAATAILVPMTRQRGWHPLAVCCSFIPTGICSG